MAYHAGVHILALEPYYAGSHRSFLDGLIDHGRHAFDLLTLPARKWKWRMRGAAIWFAQHLAAKADVPYDAIFTCDMLSVADLRSLLVGRLRRLPVICYFHENQLTYPLPDEADRDYQYAFTNITSCLAADRVWFNSTFHLETFLRAAEDLLRRMPDAVPRDLPETIRKKADVLYPGIHWIGPPGPTARESGPRTVLWNHRWEYDKGPDEFFAALCKLDEEGIPFHLAVAGEQFRTSPPIFEHARKRLGHRITHWGSLHNYQAYRQLLRTADIVVSTSIHEFFGISVLEAVSAGCRPILPNRLTYPELFPEPGAVASFHESPSDLAAALRDHLTDPSPPARSELANAVRSFSWPNRADEFDRAFDEALTTGRRHP